jgi:hypothetical protein
MLLVHVVDDEPDVEVLIRQQLRRQLAQEGRVKDNPRLPTNCATPVSGTNGHLKRSNNVRFRG